MAFTIKRHIPNTITSCNLISGCIAVFNAFLACYEAAFFFIVLGAVFDFFDGMSARLLGVSSPIGKELDSLADCITFGLAPSAMIFTFLSAQDYPSAVAFAAPYIPYVAFIKAAFSALRMAKVTRAERQTSWFVGLPTPANALFWASLIVGSGSFLSSSPAVLLAVVAMVLVCSWVLVAEIPMFALKFKTWGWRGNEVKYIFLITCIPLLAVFRVSGFAAIIAWYVVLSALTAGRQSAA